MTAEYNFIDDLRGDAKDAADLGHRWFEMPTDRAVRIADTLAAQQAEIDNLKAALAQGEDNGN